MKTISPILTISSEYVLEPGSRIVSGNEEYLIGGVIGKGGFGVIYSATCAGVHYALKISIGEIPIKKLDREAAITAALSRFNFGILPIRILTNPLIVSNSPDGDNMSGVNEKVSVGVLRDMSAASTLLADLMREKQLNLLEAIDVFLSLVNVLDLVHENKNFHYIHGDISPENIIFVETIGSTVLIDFGNAQLIENDLYAEIERDEITYNPIYMAPEVRSFIDSNESSVRLSRASDIYSLAMVFYGMLFGAPDIYTCEHISVIFRNRVTERFGGTGGNAAVENLLTLFFEDCFVAKEQLRLQRLSEVKERLEEIKGVLSGTTVSRAGIRARTWERQLFFDQYSEAVRFESIVLSRNKKKVDLIPAMSDTRKQNPAFLYGTKGSGKTDLVFMLCRHLLEYSEIIPLYIDAAELPLVHDYSEWVRSIISAILRRLFGGFGTLQADERAAKELGELLGFQSCESAAVEFLLVIDNAHLLVDQELIQAFFAEAFKQTQKTRFLLSGKAKLYEFTNTEFRSLFLSENIFYCANPDAQMVVDRLVALAGKSCSLEEAETIRRFDLLSVLLREILPFSQAEDEKHLSLSDLYRLLDRHFNHYTEGDFSAIPALAYSVRVVEAGKALDTSTMNKSFVSQAEWDGIFVNKQAFQTSIIADYFAACYIRSVIENASQLKDFAAINHVWGRQLVNLLQVSFNDENFDGIEKIYELFLASGSTGDMRNFADVLPSNIFAITGNLRWAALSVRVADAYFHTEILDGYFSSSSKVVLYEDVLKRGSEAEVFDLDNSEIVSAMALWPEKTKGAISADLEYSYRLSAKKFP